MYVATIQHLIFIRHESKQESYEAQFALYISDTPVTLKQSQDHQTYDENIHPEQGYNHAKFKRSRFNSVSKKDNGKYFSNEEVCQLSSLNMCESQNLHI